MTPAAASLPAGAAVVELQHEQAHTARCTRCCQWGMRPLFSGTTKWMRHVDELLLVLATHGTARSARSAGDSCSKWHSTGSAAHHAPFQVTFVELAHLKIATMVTYSLDDCKKHTSDKDCWLVVHGAAKTEDCMRLSALERSETRGSTLGTATAARCSLAVATTQARSMT